MKSSILWLLLACLRNTSPFREEREAGEKNPARTIFPLTGRPPCAYMATWGDEVSIRKIMNLRLWVIPKVGGGQGERTPECGVYFVKETGHFTKTY